MILLFNFRNIIHLLLNFDIFMISLSNFMILILLFIFMFCFVSFYVVPYFIYILIFQERQYFSGGMCQNEIIDMIHFNGFIVWFEACQINL
jgi:hypothetical protein